MDLVVAEPGLDGLGAMIADLIAANLERDPARRALVGGVTGTINVRVPDAGVAIGVEFAGDALLIHATPFRRAGIDVVCDSATLLELTSVPLWFGQPDVRTAEGRAVVQKMLRRELRVKGLFAHPMLLGRFQRLLSTA